METAVNQQLLFAMISNLLGLWGIEPLKTHKVTQSLHVWF